MLSKLEKQGDKWTFRYYDDGIQKRKTIEAKTFKDAQRLQMEFLISLKNKTNPKFPIAVKDFLEKYLTYIKMECAQRTYKSNKQAVEYFFKVNPHIKTFQGITFQDLQDFKTKEKARGQSINSINTKIIRLKKMFSTAKNIFNMIDQNPAVKISYIKTGKKIPRFLSVDEIEKYKIAKTKRDIYYLANLVSLYTGFRSEEVLFLNKQTDIDLPNRRISVNSKQEWQPKDYEARTNPITDNLYNILQELYKLAPKSPWLITDYTGNRPSYDNFTQCTAKVFRRNEINIKNATMYLYATHLPATFQCRACRSMR
ncbi:MAG: hypothetical protein LBV16_02490 [Elusimicrobiota bacterium]|jgi:site-specific recombinase XerD|nr:hypothetical protein [Elusimicrobiota bacterium]